MVPWHTSLRWALKSLTVLSFLLSAPPLWARWESRHDNKSLTELQNMAADELLIEATDVCIRSTSVALKALGKSSIEERQAAHRTESESSSYLRTIGEIARKKKGSKHYPDWMRKIFVAQTQKDPDKCVAAFKADHEKLTTPSLPSPAAGSNTSMAPSIEMRLQTLKSLLEKGLITKEQYEQKQAEILKEL